MNPDPDKKALFSFSTRNVSSGNKQAEHDPQILSLVTTLTSPLPNGSTFIDDFLHIYRSVCTPAQLVDAIIYRLETQKVIDRQEAFKFAIQFFFHWMSSHSQDFREDLEVLLDKLYTFLGKHMDDVSVSSSCHVLRLALEKFVKSSNSSATFRQSEPLLPPILPKSSSSALLKIHPEEIARQITLVQFNAFSSLNLSRMLIPSHILEDEAYINGSLKWAPFTEWDNIRGQLARWSATHVVGLPRTSHRIKTLTWMIEVAHYLHKIQNWEGLSSIIEGLQNLQLPQTWSGLHQKIRATYDNLLKELSSYLETISKKSLSLPFIPRLDIHINELNQLSTQLPRWNVQEKTTWKSASYKEASILSSSLDSVNISNNNSNQAASSQQNNPSPLASSHSSRNLGNFSGFADSSNSTTTNRSSMQISNSNKTFNTIRARTEALILAKLKLCQTKSFPFTPVAWIQDLFMKFTALTFYTIQENCEIMEPTKFSNSSSIGAIKESRNQSSPRTVVSKPRSPTSPRSSKSSPRSPPRSPPRLSELPIYRASSASQSQTGSPLESPRFYMDFLLTSSRDTQSYDYPSAYFSQPHSPSSSDASPTNSGFDINSTFNSMSSTVVPSSSPFFNHRSPLNRDITIFELELEKNGYYVYSTPTTAFPDMGNAQATMSSPGWILLDEDRLDDISASDLLPHLLLEYLLPCPIEYCYQLNHIKTRCIETKTSKITRLFNAASKMRWRKDLLFSAPYHSKGLKLSTPRIIIDECPQHTAAVQTVTLSNSSSATLDWNIDCSSVVNSQVFLSCYPCSGSLAPGKSIVVKIHVVLLDELQFHKILRIQAWWSDLSYATFSPLLLSVASSKVNMPFSEISFKPNQLSSPSSPLTSAQSSPIENTPLADAIMSSKFNTSQELDEPSSPRRSYWKVPLEDIKIQKRLGGTMASVLLCTLYGVDVVMKKWEMGSLDPPPADFLSELEALSLLRHPNLIFFIGACSSKGIAYIITEYVSRGNLTEYLQFPSIGEMESSFDTAHPSVQSVSSSPKSLASSPNSSPPPNNAENDKSWPNKLRIAIDIAKGMAFMHYNKIMHRDLKSLNILITEDFGAKIADMGSTKNWVTVSMMTQGVGTYDWIAPEVLKSKVYTPAADVFSFGLVLWEILHEKFPERPIEKVASGQIPDINPKYLQKYPDFVNLLHKCCSINPSERPSFSDIVVTLEQIQSKWDKSSQSSSEVWVRALKSSSSANLTLTLPISNPTENNESQQDEYLVFTESNP